MEARGGIEPPIMVLQTIALPLGDRAIDEELRGEDGRESSPSAPALYCTNKLLLPYKKLSRSRRLAEMRRSMLRPYKPIRLAAVTGLKSRHCLRYGSEDPPKMLA